MPVVPCLTCSTPVTRNAASLKRRANVFCSSGCYHAHRTTGSIDARGYRRVWVDGKQVKEHRRIIEDLLGRKLTPAEHVHHINGDRVDNRIENLSVLSHSEHSIEHHPLSWDIEAAKAMLNEGRTLSDIGKKMGVSYQAIRVVFMRRGLWPR